MSPKQSASFFLACVLACCVCGCSSTKSTEAQPLSGKGSVPIPDLKAYGTATVVGFDITPGKVPDSSYGDKFAADIFRRLKHDFGPIFREVRFGDPEGKPDEVIIGGTITHYAEMNAAGLIFGGLPVGKADLEGEVRLQNGSTKQVIYTASIEKLWGAEEWAFGAKTGSKKGLEAGAAVANTVARGRGWQHK